jgi:Protein of unknown function (DUF2380)
MLRLHDASRVLVLVGLVLSAGVAGADSNSAAAPGVGVAIVDFSYADTSGEPADQTAAHQQRLQALMAALRRDFAADRQFRLVPVSCGPAPCTVDGTMPADLRRAAAEAGATMLVLGGIHKMSTLVQWARIDVIDVATDRAVLSRLFTFRGDSDDAWQRAEAFMSQEIRAALATD